MTPFRYSNGRIRSEEEGEEIAIDTKRNNNTTK